MHFSKYIAINNTDKARNLLKNHGIKANSIDEIAYYLRELGKKGIDIDEIISLHPDKEMLEEYLKTKIKKFDDDIQPEIESNQKKQNISNVTSQNNNLVYAMSGFAVAITLTFLSLKLIDYAVRNR